MRNGLLAGPLPTGLNLPFADAVARACAQFATFSPLVAYAIKVNETGDSTDPAQMQDGTVPGTDHLSDGSNAGHGIFQLTSAWPMQWAAPEQNASFAIWHDGPEFAGMHAAETYWAARDMQGDDLVRCIFASYNAGIGGAEQGHAEGDVGKYTTKDSSGANYADRALAHYKALAAGKSPF